MSELRFLEGRSFAETPTTAFLNMDAIKKLGEICFNSADYKEGRTAFMEKRKEVLLIIFTQYVQVEHRLWHIGIDDRENVVVTTHGGVCIQFIGMYQP